MKFKVFNSRVDRYIHILAIGLMAIAIALSSVAANAEAAESLDITVYRDPDCSCCGGWIDYLTTQGFSPTIVMTADMETLKQQQGVPNDLTSCHTAVIDDYVIEGHVPAEDIKRLLVEHPQIKGIAVPGMPIGTPGMESGEIHDAFSVISFDQQGNTQVFNQY
ncbi:MAG: DUF411 domain-containing protein [Drouetiella hepatica Uher 2000/2452]|jgi:hypothetical protein|uniref:DUF411 domain-containing protein n=1 Tax=Drouetiella hepatica Uher 2000/2452 TaxID=904376 RepID=A0A951QD15_9CYAN|nr:DUF411 domain-containing protein [Drouetiella hepatica Uher 2000/2452]